MDEAGLELMTIEAITRDGAPGTVHRGRIPLGARATGAEIAVSYIVVIGEEPGPTLWINGQVHGTEVCAIVAGINFCNRLDPKTLKGCVIFTASANPLALESRTWSTQQDFGQNLDTMFPGRSNGFVTERMADRLFREVMAVRPDLLLSMHAQGTDFESMVYGVYKLPPDCPVKPEQLYRYMRCFEPFVICHQSVKPGSGEHPGNHAGALDYMALANGIPAFMIELGVAQRATPDQVSFGAACYGSICAELGMLPAQKDHPKGVKTWLVSERSHCNSDAGGMWQSKHQPGVLIKAGQEIGTVTDLTGLFADTVIVPKDVLLIAVRQDPVVHTGDSVAYLAHDWTHLDLT
ncbi:MAG: hypothetical protein CMI63_18005 [Parvularcula sp.]|nr:hypothetical protein [Parvularcula sp.]